MRAVGHNALDEDRLSKRVFIQNRLERVRACLYQLGGTLILTPPAHTSARFHGLHTAI
jgi:hypothetical protein